VWPKAFVTNDKNNNPDAINRRPWDPLDMTARGLPAAFIENNDRVCIVNDKAVLCDFRGHSYGAGPRHFAKQFTAPEISDFEVHARN
jgi:hypothetical protein